MPTCKSCKHSFSDYLVGESWLFCAPEGKTKVSDALCENYEREPGADEPCEVE